MKATMDSSANQSAARGPIPSAIYVALQSNLAIQAELQRRLLKIKSKKVQNRRNAATVSASISQCWDNVDDVECAMEKHVKFDSGSSVVEIASKKTGIDALIDAAHQSQKIDLDTTQECNKSAEDDYNTKETDASNVVTKSNKKQKSKGSSPNPKRKETRGFFVDRDGSTPHISLSSIVGEGAIEAEMQSTRVIYERKKSPTPSKEEPQTTWEEAKSKNLSTGEEVSLTIIDHKSQPPSSEECCQHVARFSFADTNIAKTKFTKQECTFLMSMISKFTEEEKRGIDWYELAVKHYAKFKKQTPWSCFCQYRSSLQNPKSRCTPWSSEEDELLLKYVTAQGPQYLLQGESIVQTCRNLFPHRNVPQLINRLNVTLLNPNYVQEAWSSDEKRRLALLMRVYSSEEKPINMASHTVHFPNRASKSVFDKWINTLDPTISYSPLTTEEGDEDLRRGSSTAKGTTKKIQKKRKKEITHDDTAKKSRKSNK